jgi:hypothetical protein
MAAASLLPLMVAGTVVAGTVAQAGASTRPSVVPNSTVTVTPSKNLINGQVVQVNMSGFNDDADGTTLFIVQCSFQVLTKQSTDYCAVAAQSTTATTTNHAATAPLTIHTGAGFHPNKAGVKCDPKNSCVVIVTDNMDPNQIVDSGFALIDLGKTTKTTVTGKKTLKAGGTLKLKAVTSGGSSPSGKVVFKDGKKTIKTVTEKASGVVKAKEKHMKKGKHKITATYSGDANNQGSKATLKVKVKK